MNIDTIITVVLADILSDLDPVNSDLNESNQSDELTKINSNDSNKPHKKYSVHKYSDGFIEYKYYLTTCIKCTGQYVAKHIDRHMKRCDGSLTYCRNKHLIKN